MKTPNLVCLREAGAPWPDALSNQRPEGRECSSPITAASISVRSLVVRTSHHPQGGSPGKSNRNRILSDSDSFILVVRFGVGTFPHRGLAVPQHAANKFLKARRY